MYIAIEGIDTAGKSTQIQALQSHYPHAIFTQEPGGTALGKRIREIVLDPNLSISAQAETLLFLADRAEHAKEILLPNQDKLIISDRSLISGIAYAKDFELALMYDFNLFATSKLLPQKVILLELDRASLQERLEQKQQDCIETRGVQYLLNLQKRLKDVLARLHIPHEIINAKQTKQQITSQIKSIIDAMPHLP